MIASPAHPSWPAPDPDPDGGQDGEGLLIDLGARRLLRRVAGLAALEDPNAVGREVLSAALELVDADSAILLRGGSDGLLRPQVATGPLAVALAERAPTDLHEVCAQPDVLLGVGLFDGDELVGALVLADSAPKRIRPGEAELVELLATHAASCLRSAEALRTLRERAASDPLTGLGHYASFHEALAASHRRPRTAVLLGDIDRFKQLNDTHGHQHGDRVLCGLADALSGALRRGDALFRIGGDEFAALVVVADEREALGAATRLRRAVRHAGLGVTVSLGVAVPQPGEADSSVLARADRALYAVKERGRDGVALADGDAGRGATLLLG